MVMPSRAPLLLLVLALALAPASPPPAPGPLVRLTHSGFDKHRLERWRQRLQHAVSIRERRAVARAMA